MSPCWLTKIWLVTSWASFRLLGLIVVMQLTEKQIDRRTTKMIIGQTRKFDGS